MFVHGIFGNGESTWTNETTGAYFPQLVAQDSTFSKADIWVHDYPSSRFSRSYSIDELADHLRRHLRDDNVIANHKQVIFVAHSMGGLVVRAYLLKYRDDISPEQVPMLYFFSTPTTGADIASLARFLSSNPQLADMRKMKTGASGLLGVWDSQWNSSQYARKVESFCAYETLPTMGIQVVQRESAEHLCNNKIDPILANHSSIVKPAGPRDESFLAFRNAYRDVFKTRTSLLRAPAWNLLRQNRGFVEASTNSPDPSCNNCWSSEVPLELNQQVFVRLHYENNGDLPARHVKLHLMTPSGLMSDALVSATLSSNDTERLQGAACIGSPAGPLVFIPEKALWYPNNSKEPLPLPYNQSVTALSSPDGLDIGDVNGGPEFASDVVVTFKTLPITAAGFRNVEGWATRIGETIEARGGVIDMDEIARLLTVNDLVVGESEVDFDGSLHAHGSVTRLDKLFPNEMVALQVFVHNENTVTLHAPKMQLVREDRDGAHSIQILVTAKETSFEVARVPLSYAPNATGVALEMAMRFPPGFCQNIHSVDDFGKFVKDEDESDGIDIGDVDPDDTALVLCILIVH